MNKNEHEVYTQSFGANTQTDKLKNLEGETPHE